MRLPKYRRHSGGQARVTIAGKDYMLGPFGSAKSKREYDRLIGEYIVSGRQKSFGVKQDELLLSELLLAYVKHAKQAYGASTRGEYYKVKLAVRPLRRLYGSVGVLQFGVLQWKNIRQYVLDGKNGKEGDPIRVPTRRYVNTFMQRVTRIFRWAAGDGDMYPGELPLKLERIEPLKVGRTKARETDDIEGVPDEIIEKTLEHLQPVIADMVRIQRLVGCRPGELCCVTADMVDRSGDIWTVDLRQQKKAHRGKKRVLYIGPKAQVVLSPYLLRGPDEFLFRPRDSERKRRQALHEQRVTPLSCGNKPGTNRTAKTDKANVRIEVFHGPTPPERREEIRRAFNAPPQKHPVRILVATDAACEGLNLQAHCWNLFHFDVPWNPSSMASQSTPLMESRMWSEN